MLSKLSKEYYEPEFIIGNNNIFSKKKKKKISKKISVGKRNK